MPLFTNFVSRLTGPVGGGRPARSEDVMNTRKALKRLGYYNGETDLEYTDANLDSSIRSFQRERGLREDGLLLPDGETEREINRSLTAGTEAPVPPVLLGSMKVNLSDDVGSGRSSRARDVRQVQRALGALGALPPAQAYEAGGIIDRRTEEGIRKFQRDNDLREDGFLRPGGETEDTINNRIAALLRAQVSESDDGEDGGESPGDDGEGSDNPPIPEPKPEPPTPPVPEPKPEPPAPPKPPPKPKPPEDKPKNDCSELEMALNNAQSILENAQAALDRQQTKADQLSGQIGAYEQEIADIDATLDKEKKDKNKAKSIGALTGMGVGAFLGAFKGGAPGAVVGGGLGLGVGPKAGDFIEEIGDAIDSDSETNTTLAFRKQALIKKIGELNEKLSEVTQIIESELQPKVDEAQNLVDQAQAALEDCEQQNEE